MASVTEPRRRGRLRRGLVRVWNHLCRIRYRLLLINVLVVAVPLVAALNAVVQHLAANTAPGDDPEEELAEDYEESSAMVDVQETATPEGEPS